MYAIEVNGNRLHDEGEHGPATPEDSHPVVRIGGGPLLFPSRAEAEAYADALFERVRAAAMTRGRARGCPSRDRYVVIEG